MDRITTDSDALLFDVAATRRIERSAAATLPPHTLMRRAGLAAARLAMALTPHARTIWIACGPGNNGGDGFEAAMHLRQRGFQPIVTWAGNVQSAPADAQMSLQRAQDAGVVFADTPPAAFDLAIDALLGIGSSRPPEGLMANWLQRMHGGPAQVLSIDLPSGLNADTGAWAMAKSGESTIAGLRHCLSLLTLKPGLFTASGRDLAGDVWFDDLDVRHSESPAGRLIGQRPARARPHASHKGSFGDVAVVGGAPGMAGAAVLAASAALHGGAGRVFLALLDASAGSLDTNQPELMFRRPVEIDWQRMAVVCGCGGGEVVGAELPRILSTAAALTLDADALNAVARDTGLQSLLRRRADRKWRTVLTPHPLEAARLLETSTSDVQADRLHAAQRLAERFAATVILKGSGSVIAAPKELLRINTTGNGRLATAGTGDVLAGMVGAALARGLSAFDAACEAAWQHGALADCWPEGSPLTASTLSRRAPPAPD